MRSRTSTRLLVPLLVATLLAPSALAGPLPPQQPEPDSQRSPQLDDPPAGYGQDSPPPDKPYKPPGAPGDPPPYQPGKPPGEEEPPPYKPPGEDEPYYGDAYYDDDEEGPDDGPPEPPPPAPPLPAKVVRVQFCVVDDGTIFPPVPVDKSSDVNPGFPNARLSFLGFLGRDFALILGLLVKNVLYAPTGVSFAAAAPTVYIPDPHPNNRPFTHGGELGDVAEPDQDDLRYQYPDIPTTISFPGEARPSTAPTRGNANPPGGAQLAQIRQDCLAAVQARFGPLAAGTLLEIVIRRFVQAVDDDNDGRIDEDTVKNDRDARGPNAANPPDKDGDGADGEDLIEPSTLLGLSPQPKCSQEPPAIMRAPVVTDPALLNLAAFGFILAHENGHALCLPDAPAGAPPRVMSPRVPPFAPGFTAREIARLRKQAQHLSGTRDKDGDGFVIARPGPVTRYSLDAVLEVAAPELDLLGAGASLKEDGSLGLLVELGRPLPPTATATYTLAVDLDASQATGAAYAVPGGERLRGTDLVVAVDVGPGETGQPAVAGTRFLVGRRGRVQPAEGANPTVLLAPVQLSGGTGRPVAIGHTLFVTLPSAALPVPLAEGFRVAASSASPGRAYDTVPLLIGSVTPDWSGPLVTLEPNVAPAGAVVLAHGSGFAPQGKVQIYAGVVPVASAVADPAGRFVAAFLVPPPSQDTAAPLAGGAAVMPVSAFDFSAGGDVARLTVPPGGAAGKDGR